MRFAITRPLVEATLDEIVTGETCEPISLGNFESYLMYKQHSVEYLRFVVWFQSYRRRYFALPDYLQNLSPSVLPSVPDTRAKHDFKLPTPAQLARYLSRGSPLCPGGNHQIALSTIVTSSTSAPLSPISSGSASTDAQISLRCPELSRQPFRVECTSVAHTFLIPSYSDHQPDIQTLDVPSDLLAVVLQNLAHTTHPSVFEPIYDLAYATLSSACLPFFLEDATKNLTIEKSIYWLSVGALTFLCGWAIGIGCLFIHYDESDRDSQVRTRAWRLFSIPLISCGGMQMFGGYRGFCAQMWGRGGAQMKPWELVLPPHHSLSRSSSFHNYPDTPKLLPSLSHNSRKTSHSTTGKVQPEHDASYDVRIGKHGYNEANILYGSSAESALARAPYFDDIELDLDAAGPVKLPSYLLPPSSPLTSPSPASLAAAKRPSNSSIASRYRDHWVAPSPIAEVVTPGAPPIAASMSSTPASPPISVSVVPHPSTPSLVSEARAGHKPSDLEKASMNTRTVAELSTRRRIFGPERPVLDPRIKAVHRRMVRELLVFGTVWTLFWTIVVCVVPWGR